MMVYVLIFLVFWEGVVRVGVRCRMMRVMVVMMIVDDSMKSSL